VLAVLSAETLNPSVPSAALALVLKLQLRLPLDLERTLNQSLVLRAQRGGIDGCAHDNSEASDECNEAPTVVA
jgi:hypothetical protein